jgi:Tol biopolymer transport system component
MPWYRGLSWAPDGRSLLINGWIETGHRGVFRVNVDTGKLNPIVLANPEPRSPNWQLRFDPDYVKGDDFRFGELSPDGNTLFYSRVLVDPDAPQGRKATQFRILARDLGTGQEREISGTPETGVHFLALSPDGQYMVLVARKALLILPSAGGEPRELLKLEGGFNAWAMAWTPDSRYLLILKGERRQFELWRIAVAGGEPECVIDELPTAPDSWRRLRIHPDGRQITFTSESAQQELWVMENFLPESKGGE